MFISFKSIQQVSLKSINRKGRKAVAKAAK